MSILYPLFSVTAGINCLRLLWPTAAFWPFVADLNLVSLAPRKPFTPSQSETIPCYLAGFGIGDKLEWCIRVLRNTFIVMSVLFGIFM